jgi:outer membrane protein assembly factor BamA
MTVWFRRNTCRSYAKRSRNSSSVATLSCEIASRARYELQEEGYFKANVTTSDLQVLNEKPGQSVVAVTLRIDEGQQYRLQQIKFIHNKVFASSHLRQAFAIKDQDVFDAGKIRLGLDDLRKLYASEGYINFVPVPNTYRTIRSNTGAD